MTPPTDRPPSADDIPDARITLRPARPDDAPLLAVLGGQVFLDTYALQGIRGAIAREVLRSFSTAALAQVLARRDCVVITAQADVHLVGYAQLAHGATHPLVPGAARAELERLYVQQPFTGRGIGARLLHAAHQAAWAAGADTVWLTSWVHNVRAIAFYAREGYVDVGAAGFEMEGEHHENRVLVALRPRPGDGTPR